MERFRALAVDRITRIERAWADLLENTEDEESAADLENDLHTLKGDCRVVGFMHAHRLCHKLEELFASARANRFRVPESCDIVATMGLRFLLALARSPGGEPLRGMDLDGFTAEIDQLLADIRAATQPPAPHPHARRPRSEGLDRVSTATMHRLGQLATRTFLEHLAARGGARERLHALWESTTKEIQRFGSVPLDDLLGRHETAGLDLASRLDKPVRSELASADVRVSASVADALDAAILHVMSNAVDHGLEAPAAREAAGKEPVGRLDVRACEIECGVAIELSDDGRGVERDAIERRGVELGLIPDAATEEEILALPFRPEFSVRTPPTVVSGRGIGLAAARRALEMVGGSVRLESPPRGGTRVVITVPTSASADLDVYCCGERAGVELSVPATFSVSTSAGLVPEATDPLEALGADVPPPTGTVVVTRDDGRRSWFAWADGPVVTRSARRLAPTGPDSVLEVVNIDGASALLLKP